MNIIVCGTRGEGKSTLSLYLAKQFADTVAIIDPRGTYNCGIECFEPMEVYEHIVSKDYKTKDGKYLPLICRFEGNQWENFTSLATILFPKWFKGFSGKISIIVDEAREFQSPHQIHPHLERILRQAPLDRVLLVQNTHQLMDWNSATKSVTDDLYLFRQIGPRNRKVVEEHCGEDVAEIAQSLPPHHLIHYWFDRRDPSGKQFEVWSNPEKWYKPLKETE